MGFGRPCLVSCVIAMVGVAQSDMRPFWALTPMVGKTPQMLGFPMDVSPTWLWRSHELENRKTFPFI